MAKLHNVMNRGEEAFADAYVHAAAETAAGMLTRRRVGGLAAVFERLANWFLGNGDILLQSEDGAWTGMDEDAARSGVVRFASRSPSWILSRLTRHADDAVKAFAGLEDARRAERLERLRQQVRAIRQELNARRDQSAVMEDAVADTQTAEAHEQAREETRRLLAEEDAALREQAQVLDEQTRARLADTRTAIADAREAFAEAWRQPLPEGANAQRTEANRRRQLLADWRAAKDAELAILRERAAIGLDPDARREYLEADLRERNRLDGRALREQADKERRAIDDAAPSQGDALLGQTRIIGHETIESREHYVRRQMAANGWTRERALAESTHLYPEDMAALAAPWLARALYAENGTSPDAAAQAAHDAGRLAESTVDAFWDAVRGDVNAVTQWKEREKARVDAETAQAARWGAERFRKDLAALADRDAQGRLAIGGGYLDDWSVRAQDAFNRGLRTEAQIAEGLGIPYGAWMTHHPLGGRGEDTITGVVGEDGRDIRASDLLDLSHEWHHVGRRFDEALFLDPNDFPDVRTPADIDDKQTAALFFYYTRMREAPREVNRASLTAEERDALTQRERPVWEAFARTVAPARDAFVRAIAAEAEPDTLRPLAEAYANAMRAHKRLADAASKQFLASIGKPRAYLNERPYRAGSVRYSVGSVDGALPTRTPLVARQALLDLVQFYKDAERDYYEAKPRRIVGTDEIVLALIPASEITLRRELENHGIPYETYNASPTHALEETSDVAKNAIARARFQIGGSTSSTTVASTKFSIREARQAIRDQNAEHPEGYTNRQTGNVAFINGTQVREMTTETSIAKTMRHGFSTYEHLHAVALAPTLYENAALVRDDPDVKNGDSKVHILRYAAPITIEREGAPVEATAWLTVKTSEQNGHRIYSLELLELTEARRITEDTASTALPRTRNLNDTVAYPGADVNPRLSVGGL